METVASATKIKCFAFTFKWWHWAQLQGAGKTAGVNPQICQHILNSKFGTVFAPLFDVMKTKQLTRASMMTVSLVVLIFSAAVAKAAGAPLLTGVQNSSPIQPTALIAFAAAAGIFINVVLRRKG